MNIRPTSPLASGVTLALASAVLFGMTTPIIGRVGRGLDPLTTASLLYAGAAVGALALRVTSRAAGRRVTRASLPRLLVVSLFGAALAPGLLAWGIADAGATAASLVLNLEAIVTVLLANLVFSEPIGRRVWGAMLAMLAGGVLLALDVATRSPTHLIGLLAVGGATVAWATDNTLTRGLAEEDPLEVVMAKGALGSTLTGGLAVAFGGPSPSLSQIGWLGVCGATGYGLSLRLYLLSQRRMGAARTGSVFAVGPFVGATIGWLLGDRTAGPGTVAGAVAFALGVYLHLSERHSHGHRHAAQHHSHAHRHDDGHHQHDHHPAVMGEHTHEHDHGALEHEHEHAPDLHHGHRHG
ncbi:MAG: EamA family transporter [Deltaproteobacteria bacterium]|nr:EamA family transporter [Deltaproteobacteria bacterium]